MSDLLEIRNYTLDIDTFDGPVHVLKNIDLTVRRGETLGIVGESGSGKTVLVRSILGLAPKRARVVGGSVRFDGTDLSSLTDKSWKKIRGVRISMIFQDPMTYLNPLFSIGRQIGDVIAAHNRATGVSMSAAGRRARSEDLLNQVGIPDPARVCDQFPHQLSGGMRQRVLIAMALSGKPDLLIADEPTTALDVTVQAQVLDLINELVAKLNLTVIMISHDVGAIATVAKRCAVMFRGEIVEEGATEDILRAPQHDYTKRLLAAVPELDAPVARGEAHEKAQPLLEVRGLAKTYATRGGGEVRAVDEVDFSVAQGEVLGIVGESGSGKSTIARLVLRLVEPTAGAVAFDGSDVTTLDAGALRRMRRHMQLVFQNPHSALNGRHTIGDAIAEPFRIQSRMSRREIEANVDRLLDTVQLPKAFRYRYPHELSGGQKQRVCIARAVALKPKLLLLDEPTSALDVSVQAQILEFLRDLRSELDLTYLFISHDLAVVREICDRVLVMNSGKIIEQGPAAQIFEIPAQEYTQQLLASARKTSTSAFLSREAV
jgi:peptide/nickel transport system ATP-binding protein